MALLRVDGALAPSDFHRLGVRSLEARPRVLRKAARRRARPLVRKYLTSRTPQTEAELVGVVSLAYRLLDPRNRASQLERVLLAQMEPVPQVPRLWTHPQAGVVPDQRPEDPADGQPSGTRQTLAAAAAMVPAPLDLRQTGAFPHPDHYLATPGRRLRPWHRLHQWVRRQRPLATAGVETAITLAMRIRASLAAYRNASSSAPPPRQSLPNRWSE